MEIEKLVFELYDDRNWQYFLVNINLSKGFHLNDLESFYFIIMRRIKLIIIIIII
jgi:hypothetical protein